MNSTHFLVIYNITFLINAHVCDSMEQLLVPVRVSLSLRVHHLGDLLEDGGSGRFQFTRLLYHPVSGSVPFTSASLSVHFKLSVVMISVIEVGALLSVSVG